MSREGKTDRWQKERNKEKRFLVIFQDVMLTKALGILLQECVCTFVLGLNYSDPRLTVLIQDSFAAAPTRRLM